MRILSASETVSDHRQENVACRREHSKAGRPCVVLQANTKVQYIKLEGEKVLLLSSESKILYKHY